MKKVLRVMISLGFHLIYFSFRLSKTNDEKKEILQFYSRRQPDIRALVVETLKSIGFEDKEMIRHED